FLLKCNKYLPLIPPNPIVLVIYSLINLLLPIYGNENERERVYTSDISKMKCDLFLSAIFKIDLTNAFRLANLDEVFRNSILQTCCVCESILINFSSCNSIYDNIVDITSFLKSNSCSISFIFNVHS